MKKILLLSLIMALMACSGNVKYVSYSDYGAVGDGVTDDFDAIIRAHAAANEAGLPVKAKAGATYYIAQTGKTAEIQTDTDWSDAKFIIDDSKVTVENRGNNFNIFHVTSKLPSQEITTVKTLKKNQTKLDLTLAYASFVVATDNTTMRYIREGLNQNNGMAQIDVFVVDKNGNVDMKAPIIWDYNTISSMIAYPIDTKTLTVKGGHFTTIANQAESRYTYYTRGIGVRRSNVVVDGLVHVITGELDHGAPYNGIVNIARCTEVLVIDCQFSGHKIYSTIGAANAPVQMGTYDTRVNSSTNVTYKDCKQINDIHSTTTWGIIASDYSKNLTYDHVEFSRFDAHMGVANATIKNSVLGRQGINIIGSGVFLIENTKVHAGSFVNLRDDYGSTFEGELIIRNCEYMPNNGRRSDAVLVNGRYSGQHNFGYTCFMPRKITIDGLIIHDNNPPDNYQGPKIFADFNRAFTNADYVEQFPYVITEEVVISNLTVKSGKPLIVSNNPYMFRNVKVTYK